MVSFLPTISEWREGTLESELNDTMQGLVKACIETGKAGELTLKLKIEPYTAKNGGHQVDITPKVESKNPKFDPGVGIFHVVTDDHGAVVDLQREDPAQAKMFEELRKDIGQQ